VRGYEQSARYAGEIQLFRAENRNWLHEDVAAGWESRAERIRVHDIPGDHFTLFSEPMAQRRIAEEIGRALGRFGSR
jgi:hypothetical protein